MAFLELLNHVFNHLHGDLFAEYSTDTRWQSSREGKQKKKKSNDLNSKYSPLLLLPGEKVMFWQESERMISEGSMEWRNKWKKVRKGDRVLAERQSENSCAVMPTWRWHKRGSRSSTRALMHARPEVNEPMLTWASVNGRRGKIRTLYRRKWKTDEDTREKKKKAPVSVLTGPRCPQVIVLWDCPADICLPAALSCYSQPLSCSESPGELNTTAADASQKAQLGLALGASNYGMKLSRSSALLRETPRLMRSVGWRRFGSWRHACVIAQADENGQEGAKWAISWGCHFFFPPLSVSQATSRSQNVAIPTYPIGIPPSPSGGEVGALLPTLH